MKKLLLLLFVVLLLMMAFAGPVFADPPKEPGHVCTALSVNVPDDMTSTGGETVRNLSEDVFSCSIH